jgi:ferredoxin
VREGRDVDCYPGENLREVALREGVELYGLKGRLGNCGGCGQCITCFVDVLPGGDVSALSPRTSVEEQKLRRRPDTWRLACQALVEKSVLVLTRPQVGFPDAERLISEARGKELPVGPIAWPEPPAEESVGESSDRPAPVDAPQEDASVSPSATSDEGPEDPAAQR